MGESWIPEADAPVNNAGDISLTYFDDDLARSITQDGITTTLRHADGLHTNIMLLPLNATTTGESLTQTLNYAPERAPMDVVTPTSLDLVNKLAVLLE